MKPYEWTDSCTGDKLLVREVDGIPGVNHHGYFQFGPTTSAICRELLRVAQQREDLCRWLGLDKMTAERIATLEAELEAVRRVHIIGPSPAEVLASEMRMKAMEAENARLRGAGAPGIWVASGARDERAAVLAYLREYIAPEQPGTLADAIEAGEHLSGSSS